MTGEKVRFLSRHFVFPQFPYHCSTDTLTRILETKVCSNHHISTQAIRSLLLDGIRRLSEYTATDPEGFEKSFRADKKIQQEAAARALKKQLIKDRKRSAALDTLIPKLYEAYALEKITEKRFGTILAAYEAEQAELEQSIAKDQQALDTFVQDKECYSSGHRTQQVDIRFRRLGFVNIPDDLEPLTPEEQADQDKPEAKRAKYREKYCRRKELKAQREAKAAQVDEENTTETA